jgi:hypothetical protein
MDRGFIGSGASLDVVANKIIPGSTGNKNPVIDTAASYFTEISAYFLKPTSFMVFQVVTFHQNPHQKCVRIFCFSRLSNMSKPRSRLDSAIKIEESNVM